MKKILVLHFLFLPFIIFSQTFDYSKSIDKLKEWEEFTDENDKSEFVDNFKKTLDKTNCIYLYSKLDEFHVIDIDRDGLKDIFYSGNCMTESGVIAVYRNNGNSFEELIGILGVIYQISDYCSNLPFSFTVNDQACCGGFTNVFEKYVLILENEIYKYKLQLREDWPYDIDFPEKYFKKSIAFKTTKEKYNLRLSPKIDNTTEMDRPYEDYGNTIRVYPENSLGVAIAEKKDETGRIWWFVRMNNKSIKELEYTSNIGNNSKEPTYSLGWMSSKFIEKIE